MSPEYEYQIVILEVQDGACEPVAPDEDDAWSPVAMCVHRDGLRPALAVMWRRPRRPAPRYETGQHVTLNLSPTRVERGVVVALNWQSGPKAWMYDVVTQTGEKWLVYDGPISGAIQVLEPETKTK